MRLLTSLFLLLFSFGLSAQCFIEVEIVSSSCSDDGFGFFVDFTVEGNGDSLWQLRDYNIVGEYNTREVFRLGPLGPNTPSFLVFEDTTNPDCTTTIDLPIPDCPTNPCDSFFVSVNSIPDQEPCSEEVSVVIDVFSTSFPVILEILTINGNQLVDSLTIAESGSFTRDLPTGTFTIIVTDPEGCQMTQIISLFGNQGLNVFIETIGDLCTGDEVVLNATVDDVDPAGLLYIWNTGESTQRITASDIGTQYSVTVTNTDGCLGVDQTFLSQDTVEFISFPNVLIGCDSDTATLSIPDPIDGFAYRWFGPLNQILTGASVQVTMAGWYSVEGQGEQGCNIFGSVRVTDAGIPPFLSIESFGQDTLECNGVECFGIVGLNNIDFENIDITWDGPEGVDSLGIPVGSSTSWCTSFPGVYTATLIAVGCDTVTLSYEVGDLNCQLVSGTLWLDQAANCAADAEDTPVPGYVITVIEASTGDMFYTLTDAQGNWAISLSPGTYLVEPVITPEQPFVACPDPVTVILGNTPVTGVDVFLPVLTACPQLSTSVTIPFLRRCFDGFAYVEYENNGSATAENARLVVTLDELLVNATSSIPASSRDGQTFTYELGDVPPFTSVRIYFEFKVSCEAELGQSHCIEAKITPDDPCTMPDNWSGALVNVIGSSCDGDSLTFTISNVGDNPMSVPLSYIVVEDGIMLSPVPIQNGLLEPSEDYLVTVPANGSTYMVITNQEPNAPGADQPTAVAEGCGRDRNGNFSTGFTNILELDSGNPAQFVACRRNVGSYDPNDKMGYPLGYSGGNIPEGTRLDYEIRFQNTGTDTAFTVVISDTISEALDLATFKTEAASHPYTLSLDTQRVLTFTFDNILLPDSSVNLAGSQGVVSFSIDHNVNLLPGDVIDNEAAIYFDFNDPIITNVSRHRIAKDGLPVGVRSLAAREVPVSVYPNPSNGRINISLPQQEVAAEDVLVVADVMGRPMEATTYGTAANGWDLSHLPVGYYLLLINDRAGRTKGRTGFVIR